MVRVLSSTSAARRIEAVTHFFAQSAPGDERLIVGATRGAADEVARRLAARQGATFGLHRFSLTQLAAKAAARVLARMASAPVSRAGTEATAARVVFEALAAGDLDYFAPVARTPGFAKALARTLQELRLAGLGRDRFGSARASARDVGRLLGRLEDRHASGEISDRAGLFRVAAAAWTTDAQQFAGLSVALLDVPLESVAERDFAGAIANRASDGVATIPVGDERSEEAWTSLGASVEVLRDSTPATTDLAHLRRYVFSRERPTPRGPAGDVRLFSAPGEGREAVEIVRRVLDEAARGVPFDEMAVLLRVPGQYLGLLEHACARAAVPVYFDQGTRRPDPAGRAFIALLSCACEGLSAKRFDEYLSLGQVPQVGEAGSPDPAARMLADPVRARDDVVGALSGPDPGADEQDPLPSASDPPATDTEAVVAGTLRSPWKWEELIVESAVVGGRDRADGKARWRRRLEGLAADYRYRLVELGRDEPESPLIARFERDLRNLAHLQAFALPIIDELADWPDEATWGDWLDRFTSMAGRALRQPTRVLEVLAELEPMRPVGPVGLGEARDVLHDRLVALEFPPPRYRYGRVFVGTPDQARGRAFRVVFVPGLAERVVPQRPREDPLLLDEDRRAVDDQLVRQEQRDAGERLLLRIAIGAAGERMYFSFPRLDVAQSRARVPSFYALEVVRALTGTVPDHRVLAADAAEEAAAHLAWPAPADASRAIDDLEHDLSSLKPLLDSRDRAAVRGRAHYLLGLNDALRRSVISRWARGRPQWSDSDGIVRVTPGIAEALDKRRLGRRAYSVSALQRFSSCPYQFLLATIHRLEPWDEPEPLLRMDPLTRGRLFHEVQAVFARSLQAAGELPVTPDTLARAAARLDGVLDQVAAEYEERLAPAIGRVWRDEVDDLRRDLGIWLQKQAAETTWRPAYFEFSFGLRDEGRDPRSLKDPVALDGLFTLHGSVDLIEEHQTLGVLRVTDHKTGRNRCSGDLIVGGGTVLQPVLYSAAVAQGLDRPVVAGRLFYCTTAGGFADHVIEMSEYNRRQGLEVLEIIDRAIEQGFLAAAPAERACGWCDFRAVCGPREEERVARKAADRLADLSALRAMR